MKEDAPTPERPPAKRRQLEQALDLWLATWLARDDLTPSERRRVNDERERRRVHVPSVVLGFTGTRAGLTPQQRATVRTLLAQRRVIEAHHGDCVGSDEQFHSLCLAAKVPVVLHPPDDGKLRAFCSPFERSERARPYLERNKDIVRVAQLLIAAPKEAREPAPGRGQGTWSTVRYARQRGTLLCVVMPNGETGGSE
jgi:hypothetical protein